MVNRIFLVLTADLKFQRRRRKREEESKFQELDGLVGIRPRLPMNHTKHKIVSHNPQQA